MKELPNKKAQKIVNKKSQSNPSPAFLFFLLCLEFLHPVFLSAIDAVIQMSIAILNYIRHSPMHSIINSIHISFEVSNFFFLFLFPFCSHGLIIYFPDTLQTKMYFFRSLFVVRFEIAFLTFI